MKQLRFVGSYTAAASRRELVSAFPWPPLFQARVVEASAKQRSVLHLRTRRLAHGRGEGTHTGTSVGVGCPP